MNLLQKQAKIDQQDSSWRAEKGVKVFLGDILIRH